MAGREPSIEFCLDMIERVSERNYWRKVSNPYVSGEIIRILTPLGRVEVCGEDVRTVYRDSFPDLRIID